MNMYNQILQYNSRYEQVASEIEKGDAIKLIEQKYCSVYDTKSSLDVWDQLLICESLQESTPLQVNTNTEINNTNENGNVNGSVNDTSKRKVKFELTESKLGVITELKKCTFRTSPIEIADLLEKLFSDYPSQEEHWLYIAQHWPPRPIIRTISKMIKQQTLGQVSIKDPPAYFTKLLQYRKKRRIK